jgi:hypothetical protein
MEVYYAFADISVLCFFRINGVMACHNKITTKTVCVISSLGSPFDEIDYLSKKLLTFIWMEMKCIKFV